MWIPESYEQIEAAIGVVAEGHRLDFKRELGRNEHIAKDVASFTLDGGVIIFGAEEEEESGLLGGIRPVPLKGAPERIAQIIESSVDPLPAFEIIVLTETQGDAVGVIVVVVPPSAAAPHMAGMKYHARNDRTTRDLPEVEVARLYRQRMKQAEAVSSGPSFEGFRAPSGAGGRVGGVGMLRAFITTLHPFVHADGRRLKSALSNAGWAARQTTESLLPAKVLLSDTPFLHWRPRSTIGWESGDGVVRPDVLSTMSMGATYEYEGRFSCQALLGLESGPDGRLAYEHFWAAELTEMIALAGLFFAGSTARCKIDVSLQGLQHSVSALGQGARPRRRDKVIDDSYSERVIAPADTLRSKPDTLAEELLDRFMVPLMDNWDLFEILRGHLADDPA